MSTRSSYGLDIAVERIEILPKANITTLKDLQVEFSFYNQPLTLTSSRLNLKDFMPDSTIFFKDKPENLRKLLSRCGLPYYVHCAQKLIGSGVVMFPESFVQGITTEEFSLTHAASTQFELQAEVVGRMEILCRLYLKCEERKPNEDTDCADRRVNPKDIMFVLGDQQECPTSCNLCSHVLPPSDDDNVLALDLERFHKHDVDPLRPLETSTASPTANAVTCSMKKMIRSTDAVLKTMFKRNAPFHPYHLTSRNAGLKSSVSGADLSERPPSIEMQWFSHVPIRPAIHKDYCNSANEPDVDFKGLPAKPIRFCQVCLSNMSWLPSFAACPNCGVKPKVFVKEDAQKQLTADQIIMDFLDETPTNSEGQRLGPCEIAAQEVAKKDQRVACRCTCSSGKPCAHCRIRSLCSDIFQGEECCKLGSDEKKHSTADICSQYNTPEEDRPHLQRVFSELRDLYHLKISRPDYSSKNLHEEESKSITKNVLESPAFALINKIDVPVSPRKSVYKVRHKNCVKKHGTVPRNHGWDWSSSTATVKHGWKPGFVRKPIKRIMNFFLRRSFRPNEEKKEPEVQKPTLRVYKNRGEIFITFQSNSNNTKTPTSAITFKIVKSDFAVALSEIKKKLKAKGYRKCSCHKSVMLCVCRSVLEKKQLERALDRECTRRGMENCVDQMVFTDTSESEPDFDIDVTPPACMPQSAFSKPRTVNRGTQFRQQDKNVPPIHPIKPGNYWRAYNCAAGDQYTGTAFGMPGEVVFEDGVFGYRGGGVHGPGTSPGYRPKNTLIWGSSTGGPILSVPGMPARFVPKGGGGNSGPIPVRMTERQKRKQAMVEQQNLAEAEKLKQRPKVNMMKYLKSHDAFSRPKVGPDGMTDAQRRRYQLRLAPCFPFEVFTRHGNGGDSCCGQCYPSCATPWFGQCCTYF